MLCHLGHTWVRFRPRAGQVRPISSLVGPPWILAHICWREFQIDAAQCISQRLSGPCSFMVFHHCISQRLQPSSFDHLFDSWLSFAAQNGDRQQGTRACQPFASLGPVCLSRQRDARMGGKSRGIGLRWPIMRRRECSLAGHCWAPEM